MIIYDISGLEVGNAEELYKVFDKMYARHKIIQVLEVSRSQMTFIAEDFDVYGETKTLDNGRQREIIYFDSAMGPVELRIAGEEDD